MQSTGLHMIAAIFFVLFLLVLGLLVIVFTYVEEIVRRVRELSLPRSPRVVKVDSQRAEAARKVIASRRRNASDE